MNKNAKAAIAVGAGVVLLLGGGGTLALWNTSADLNAGTVESGTLKMAVGADTGTWYHAVDANHDGVPDLAGDGTYAVGTAVDPTSYAVVPGDILVYKITDITLDFQGGSLYYYLGLTGFDPSDASDAGYTVSPATVVKTAGDSLGTADTSYSSTKYGPVTPYAAAATTQVPVYHVTDATAPGAATENESTITATVAVSFGSATVTDEDAADANGTAPEFSTITLSNAALTAQQTLLQ